MVVIRGVAQSQARSSWRIHTGSVSHQLCGEEPGSFCQLQISQNQPTSPSKHKFPPPKIPAISGSVSYMRKFLSNIKRNESFIAKLLSFQNCHYFAFYFRNQFRLGAFISHCYKAIKL